jgi:hypothetical protein
MKRLCERSRWVAPILGLLWGAQLFFSGAALAKKADPQVDFYADLSTLIFSAAPANQMITGPFYVEGPIYPGGTLDGSKTQLASPPPNPIGKARCWGWFPSQSDPAFNVLSTNIVFNDGNTVEMNGPGEVAPGPDLDVPIVGGAGRYLNVRGQVIQHFLGGGGANDTSAQFRFTFILVGAPNSVP